MVDKEGGPCNLHFFRLLLPGFFKKLAIPPACVKHVVKEKCNMTSAVITSPNGESWHVDVCKMSLQARMYFGGEGWLKFVHAHNLGLGYLLVFCYKGNMMFSFRAYDLSSCEIASYASIGNLNGACDSYASIGNRNGDLKGDEENNGVISEKEETSIEKKTSKVKIEDQNDFDECATVKKRKISESKVENKKISGEFPTVNKKTISKQEVHRKKITEKSKQHKSKNQTEISSYKGIMNSLHHERIISNNWSKKARFEATISPYNLYQSYMNIPWRFCDMVGLTSHQELFLIDPKGRRWFVRLNHCRVLCGNKTNRSQMSTGWKHFAFANNVKAGDKCVFELVSKKNGKVVTFKVQVGEGAL